MKKTNDKLSGIKIKNCVFTDTHNEKHTNNNFIKNRRKKINIESLYESIKKGDRTSLSIGITLIESQNNLDRKLANNLINKCLSQKQKQTLRVGITGVPGVGKSTFIESLGNKLANNGHKIAVLAIDPSSRISKGSILGDKTRMAKLVKQDNAFIRPSANRTALGGVGQYTRETIILCEAAGYEIIFIETVGVGQNEISVSEMVDFFLLLKLPGAGDGLQGIKRGVIEMADAIIINKADGDNKIPAKIALNDFKNALHLYKEKESLWQPKVLLCSSINETGIEEAWDLIKSHKKITLSNGYFNKNRAEQNSFWMMKSIEYQLKNDFFEDKKIKSAIKQQTKLVRDNKISPFQVAKFLVDLYKSSL